MSDANREAYMLGMDKIDAVLEKLYREAFNAGLEAAAKACEEELARNDGITCAEAIRAMKLPEHINTEVTK